MKLKSRRDQEEGGELDCHEEVRRFCGSRRDQEAGGGAVADPEVSPEEIKSREVELGLKVGLPRCCFCCFPTAELRTLSLRFCSA